MKLAFFVDKVSFGGGERILQTLISEFAKLGYDLILYTYNKEWFNITGTTYEVKILSCPPLGFIGKLKSIIELCPILKKDKPDCIIVFALNILEAVIFAALISKIPVITSERVDPRFLPTSILHRKFKKIVYYLCSGIVFQTDAVRNLFSYKIQQKSVVIPNMIMDDLPDICSVRNKEIVAVGRLSSEKNFVLLIEVFSLLNRKDYKLSIYGDGPDREKLEKLIASLNMKDYIFLKGRVNQVVDYIKNADIFVLASMHEGMPNALIEAMAMGLACVATDVPSKGCQVIINNKINGLLVPVQNKESLLKAITYYINNNEIKKTIQQEASNVRKTNSKDVIIPQWIEYIHQVIKH